LRRVEMTAKNTSDPFVMTLLFIGSVAIAVTFVVMLGYFTYCDMQDTPPLGAEVQTTYEYTMLFNDSFTGRVVRSEGWNDPALTIRNSEGVERRIATKWIEVVD
jgi:hypothetical protein